MSLSETTLHEQWLQVYKYKMPPHVERQSMAEIQDAIEFGRKKYGGIVIEFETTDSIVFEDNHNNLT
jgi:hypothetical protein